MADAYLCFKRGKNSCLFIYYQLDKAYPKYAKAYSNIFKAGGKKLWFQTSTVG